MGQTEQMSDSAVTAARIPLVRLNAFIADVLRAAGLESQDAARCAELMATADARGEDSQGVFRLPQYVRRIQSGGINPRPMMRLIEDHPATGLLDGDNGMGHLVMSRAAELAIEKAQRAGVGWVGARCSNHAGPAALYAMMPLTHDMVGIYFAVGSANHMAPWGGTDLLLSTNPIAMAVPAGNRPPVVLDMATSVASFGKVKSRIQRGEPLPEGWMIDRQGSALTDPTRVSEGSLLPIGGYKGYGLALLVGLLAGTLNGAAFGSDVIDFNADFRSLTNTGHCILALDVARFADISSFKRAVDTVCALIVGSSRAHDGDEIRIPGDSSARALADHRLMGVAIPPQLRSELDRLAASLGVSPLTP